MTVEVKRIVDKFPTHYACFGEDSAFLLQAFNRAPVNTVLYNLLQDISDPLYGFLGTWVMKSKCSDISEHLKDNTGDYMATQLLTCKITFGQCCLMPHQSDKTLKGHLREK